MLPEFGQKFELTEDRIVCKICKRLRNKGKVGDDFVLSKIEGYSSGLIEKFWLHPHVCLLETLVLVECKYRGKVIGKLLFDKWMALNSGNYQLGVSDRCMLLWKDMASMKQDRSCLKTAGTNTLPSERFKWLTCNMHGGRYVDLKYARGKRMRKAEFCVLDEFWKFSSDADKAKTNISAGQILFWVVDNPKSWELVKPYFHLLSETLSNVTVVSLVMHMIGNKSAPRMLQLMLKHKICCVTSKQFADWAKTVSIALRRTSRWPDGSMATLEEVTGCAGWELAIGRSVNITDWKEEKQKRTTVSIPLALPHHQKRTKATNAQYINILTPILENIMRSLIPSSGVRESWADFVLRRQSWMSSGSTGGEYVYMEDGHKHRVNKHAYFETVTCADMLKWLDSTPRIEAVASEKFEMGKARAIYGTKPIEYSITSYVLDNLEDVMYKIPGIENGLLGRDCLASVLRRKIIAQTPGSESTMLDYADFNYQHTLEAQSAVFAALARVLSETNSHPDKVRAAKWVAEGLLNQWCTFPGPKEVSVRITQGMFSGCRGTNVINTSLNLAYFLLSKQEVSVRLGLQPSNLYNIHQGDDVWITNGSRIWAIALFRHMESCGFEFQASKQMFDTNRGEFLRVVYTHEGCRGYLARSIATTIIKPIQSTEINSPAERAVALNSQLAVLVRRGLTKEASHLLWHAIVPYAATVEHHGKPFSIPIAVLKKHYLDNGLDLGPPGTLAARSSATPAIPILRLESAELVRVVKKEMSTDYIRYISPKINMVINAESWIDSLHLSNVSDSLRPKDKMECLSALMIKLEKWKKSLILGPVVRNETEYEQALSGNESILLFELDLHSLERALGPKISRKAKRQVANMLRCIASSPFKNLSDAMRATGLDGPEAAILAMTTCKVEAIRRPSMLMFNKLRDVCGDGVALAILDGLRSGSTTFEGDFHPLILAWVTEYVVEDIANEALQKNMRSVELLKEAMNVKFLQYMKIVIKSDTMRAISHY